jgi:hypothetical protein
MKEETAKALSLIEWSTKVAVGTTNTKTIYPCNNIWVGRRKPRHRCIPSMFHTDGNNMYQPLPYSQPQPISQTMQYGNIHNAAGVIDGHYTSQNVFPVAPLIQHPQSESPELYSHDQYGQQDLVDILGDLKMDSAGSGALYCKIIRMCKLI